MCNSFSDRQLFTAERNHLLAWAVNVLSALFREVI
jgi:hypothetical protein